MSSRLWLLNPTHRDSPESLDFLCILYSHSENFQFYFFVVVLILLSELSFRVHILLDPSYISPYFLFNSCRRVLISILIVITRPQREDTPRNVNNGLGSYDRIFSTSTDLSCFLGPVLYFFGPKHYFKAVIQSNPYIKIERPLKT